ncbi:hypothetical protein BCV72DRAFT_318437 [Rhizopus microsporus var. microsporus]|uniref:Uncharacterized protein n=1 Tax=Rhizopus microsporus var. microsporus TaxID=86635 RepID=A0A1X0QRP4_RHIZD|nr:hypothetical protein BCV72DRAFT_318437 [Rhizopus microsporus var. microsporus]
MDRIRKEVEYGRTKPSSQQRNTCDSCACIVNFKIPCFHTLSQYDIIPLSAVNRRWWINHAPLTLILEDDVEAEEKKLANEECIEMVQEDDEKIEENEEKENKFEKIEDALEETDTAACKEENNDA